MLRGRVVLRAPLVPMKLTNARDHLGVLWGDDPYYPLLKVASVHEKGTFKRVFAEQAEEVSGEQSKVVGVLSDGEFYAMGKFFVRDKVPKDHYMVASDSIYLLTLGDDSVVLKNHVQGSTLARDDSVKPIRGASDDRELDLLFYAERYKVWALDYKTRESKPLLKTGRPIIDFRYDMKSKLLLLLLGPESSATLAMYDLEGNRVASLELGEVTPVSRFKLIDGNAFIPWRKGFKVANVWGVRKYELGVMVTAFSKPVAGKVYVGLGDGRVLEVKKRKLLRLAPSPNNLSVAVP